MFSIYVRHLMENKHKFVSPMEKLKILKVQNIYRERKLRQEFERLKQRNKNSAKLMTIKNNLENQDIFYHILK